MASPDISADYEVYSFDTPPEITVTHVGAKQVPWYVWALDVCPNGSTGGGGGSGDCPDDRPDTGMLYPRG